MLRTVEASWFALHMRCFGIGFGVGVGVEGFFVLKACPMKGHNVCAFTGINKPVNTSNLALSMHNIDTMTENPVMAVSVWLLRKHRQEQCKGDAFGLRHFGVSSTLFSIYMSSRELR